MHAEFKRKILSCRQRTARCQDTLDDRVIRKVEEHDNLLQNTGLIKRTAEIFGHIVLCAHGGKHNAKLLFTFIADSGLTRNLHGKLIVLHAGTGEDRQLLATDQRHQRVNGRDARVDIVLRVHTGNRVDWRAVDVGTGNWVDIAQPVNRAAGAVKHAAQQFGGKGKLHRMALQARTRIVKGDAARALKDLHHNPLAFHLHNTALTHGSVIQADVNHFFEGCAFHVVQNNQRTVDFTDSQIIDQHDSVASLQNGYAATRSARSLSISAVYSSNISRRLFGISYFIFTSLSNKPVCRMLEIGTLAEMSWRALR